MHLSTLIAPYLLLDQSVDPVITHLSADSRNVTEGSIFAAFKGTLADGRDYIEQAIASGASAILAEPGLAPMSVPYIAIENPRALYAKIASRLYAGQPETLIAITGTNGKSSTVEFLRQIWSAAGYNAACFGTLGIATDTGTVALSHTTPDATALHKTLADLKAQNVTHCAMEASSHGLDQYRLEGVNLSATAFTNLSQDHFDYHDGMEDYFRAKTRLFLELARKGTPCVINVDGEHGQRLANMCAHLDVMRVGFKGDDLKIISVMPKEASQVLVLEHKAERYEIELPLAGEYQVYNAVSAAGLALVTGVDAHTVFDRLTKLTGVSGRMQNVGMTSSGAPVFIDFAHSPDGLESLLKGLRPHTSGDIVVVFGCGGDRDPAKREIMGRVAAQMADKVIVTDDNPRSEKPENIRAQVLKGCPEAIEIGDRAKAIAEGISYLRAGDCLVVAGKGHESGQIIGDKVIPFNDAQIAKKILDEVGS